MAVPRSWVVPRLASSIQWAMHDLHTGWFLKIIVAECSVLTSAVASHTGSDNALKQDMQCRHFHLPHLSLQLRQLLQPLPQPSRPQLSPLRSPLLSKSQSRDLVSRSKRAPRSSPLPLTSWFLSRLSTRIALLSSRSVAPQHLHHR